MTITVERALCAFHNISCFHCFPFRRYTEQPQCSAVQYVSDRITSVVLPVIYPVILIILIQILGNLGIRESLVAGGARYTELTLQYKTKSETNMNTIEVI